MWLVASMCGREGSSERLLQIMSELLVEPPIEIFLATGLYIIMRWNVFICR